jgi:TonB family protein
VVRLPWALVLIAGCCVGQVTSQVQRLVAIKRYPPLARAALIQGTVELRCSIMGDGAVNECRLSSGNLLLFAAAFENLKVWTFKAPSEADREAGDVTMVYTFELAGAPVRDEPKAEFSFEFPNHVRFVSQPACADHVPCTPEEKMAHSALADQSDGHQGIPVLTVCQALKDPLKHSGSIVVVVGSWVGTGEGSWLSETCDLKVVINDRAYAPSLWTSYTSSDQAPPPRLPVGFKWNKPAIRQALAEVKKTTLLQHRAGWYAIFGRLEVDTSGCGLGHLNHAPAQLIWPTTGGYLKLK